MLRLGQQVILVFKDEEPLPPVGATGEVVSTPDEVGDCEVLFPDYPCPVSEPEWVVPQTWLVPIYPMLTEQELNASTY